jgi:hypothetical protein
MENSATFDWIEQPKISDIIRTLIRRRANENGGISKFARSVNVNPQRIYNQMNRGNGVLAELIVLCAQNGDDGPLRVVADACNCEIVPKMKFLRNSGLNKPVRFYALGLHHACSHITTLVEQALLDGHFKTSQKERVIAAMHEMRKKMAELRARIEEEGR